MESRDKAVSAALPPPFPGEKQKGEKQKPYPISCLWHVEVRTLFYNDPINADQMKMAVFGEAPSVGSLLVQAALPGRAEGSLSRSPPLPGWSWALSLGSPDEQHGVIVGPQAQRLSNTNPSLDWKTQKARLCSFPKC